MGRFRGPLIGLVFLSYSNNKEKWEQKDGGEALKCLSDTVNVISTSFSLCGWRSHLFVRHLDLGGFEVNFSK